MWLNPTLKHQNTYLILCYKLSYPNKIAKTKLLLQYYSDPCRSLVKYIGDFANAFIYFVF